MNKVSTSNLMMWVALVLMIVYVLYINLDKEEQKTNFLDEYPLIEQW